MLASAPALVLNCTVTPGTGFRFESSTVAVIGSPSAGVFADDDSVGDAAMTLIDDALTDVPLTTVIGSEAVCPLAVAETVMVGGNALSPPVDRTAVACPFASDVVCTWLSWPAVDENAIAAPGTALLFESRTKAVSVIAPAEPEVVALAGSVVLLAVRLIVLTVGPEPAPITAMPMVREIEPVDAVTLIVRGDGLPPVVSTAVAMPFASVMACVTEIAPPGAENVTGMPGTVTPLASVTTALTVTPFAGALAVDGRLAALAKTLSAAGTGPIDPTTWIAGDSVRVSVPTVAVTLIVRGAGLPPVVRIAMACPFSSVVPCVTISAPELGGGIAKDTGTPETTLPCESVAIARMVMPSATWSASAASCVPLATRFSAETPTPPPATVYVRDWL